ncbi:unnamed protein product, partial [marine sediment metagenome]
MMSSFSAQSKTWSSTIGKNDNGFPDMWMKQ